MAEVRTVPPGYRFSFQIEERKLKTDNRQQSWCVCENKLGLVNNIHTEEKSQRTFTITPSVQKYSTNPPNVRKYNKILEKLTLESLVNN